MDRHRVICGECFLVPDIFVNLTDRKDSSLILDEKQKDAVLDGRKLHQVAVHPDFFLIVVHRKASRLVDVRPGSPRGGPQLRISSELGFDSGNQFQRIKGLGHIIVRSHV